MIDKFMTSYLKAVDVGSKAAWRLAGVHFYYIGKGVELAFAAMIVILSLPFWVIGKATLLMKPDVEAE